MKVSDLIAQFLAKHVRHVFCVSGGADLHIIHSIWKTHGLQLICPQSEAAAGFAADAYARLNGLGVALATSGPGATNLVTPISAAYYDSVPTIWITGNQTIERMKTYGTRQYGFQATPIVPMVRDITKWAMTVTKPDAVQAALDHAFHHATTGRRGPVLIDIPDDVQRASA